MIRRRQPPPPPPSSPWAQRVAAARALIRHHRNDPTTEARLDQVEAALNDADRNQANTAQTMVTASETHDPEAELDQLHIDITALAAAHQEVADLRPRPERNRP